MRYRIALICALSLLIGLFAGLWFAPASVQAQTANCLATPFSNGCYAGIPAARYQLLLDEMTMQPQPRVEQLPVNELEVYKYAFRQLSNAGTTVHNAPNGAILKEIYGEKYVTTMARDGEWLMIQPGEWVRESDTEIIQPSSFSGVLLNEHSLDFTLAWVLLPDRPAPYPGAELDTSRPRLERYTPVYLYESVLAADGWRWYLIAPDTWIKQTSIGKVVLAERPEGVKGRWVAGDLYEQVFVAYEDDQPIFATLMSSGRPQYPTLEGTFQTWQRMTADSMSGAEGRDDFYSLDYVPWVLYYDESYAVHAVYWHDRFGYRASRGCLGLSVTDAAWLFEWTLEGGYELPYVHVFSSGQYVNE